MDTRDVVLTGDRREVPTDKDLLQHPCRGPALSERQIELLKKAAEEGLNCTALEVLGAPVHVAKN